MKKLSVFYEGFLVLFTRRSGKGLNGYCFQVWSRLPGSLSSLELEKLEFRKLIYGGSPPYQTLEEAQNAAKTLIDKRIARVSPSPTPES